MGLTRLCRTTGSQKKNRHHGRMVW
jgi:hypothetical protein